MSPSQDYIEVLIEDKWAMGYKIIIDLIYLVSKDQVLSKLLTWYRIFKWQNLMAKSYLQTKTLMI